MAKLLKIVNNMEIIIFLFLFVTSQCLEVNGEVLNPRGKVFHSAWCNEDSDCKPDVCTPLSVICDEQRCKCHTRCIGDSDCKEKICFPPFLSHSKCDEHICICTNYFETLL